jgi:sensor histidine kinase YesM
MMAIQESPERSTGDCWPSTLENIYRSGNVHRNPAAFFVRIGSYFNGILAFFEKTRLPSPHWLETIKFKMSRHAVMGKWGQKYRRSAGLRIGLHIVYWILAWGFLNLLFGYGSILNPLGLLYSFIILLITASVSYWIVYLLIPRFLGPGKYGFFITGMIFTVIVSLDLELITTMLFFIFLEKFQVTSMLYGAREVYSLLSGTYFVVFLSVAIKLGEFWYREQNRKQVAMKEKVEAELKLLKSQIHPHFLFNTLNNIYSLALQKSDQAPDAVLKLSELLDYLIYHGENDKVPLSRETELIRNYIELENLRYGERLKVDWQVNGDPESVQVAPLLLMPLVENAFKHGISKTRSLQRLTIKLEITGRNVDFYIENTKPSGVVADSRDKGMGLTNLRKRLDLLYRERNTLKIFEQDQRYTVHLHLKT